jgi:hypothetical protein
MQVTQSPFSNRAQRKFANAAAAVRPHHYQINLFLYGNFWNQILRDSGDDNFLALNRFRPVRPSKVMGELFLGMLHFYFPEKGSNNASPGSIEHRRNHMHHIELASEVFGELCGKLKCQ